MRCIKKVTKFIFFTPKLMPCGQNPIGGRWHHSSCTWMKIFVSVPDCYTCHTHSSHFHFHTRWPNTSSRDIASKFCQKLDDTQAQKIQKTQKVFGNDKTQIRKWNNCFKHGHTSLESKAYSGRPFTDRNKELIQKVRWVVMEDLV